MNFRKDVSTMLVKICGIKTKHAAQVVAEAGADFIGFVFAESKRKITPKLASEIAKTLPSTIKKVGVFVNEPVNNMIAIAEQVGLDYIQLHGDEDATIAEQLPYPIIKAFSVDQLTEINSYPCEFYLIDSPRGKYRGGTGKTFNWKLIKELDIDPSKMILAGGLSPENIKEAIYTARPTGVDVSSGVETNQEKDDKKIIQFVKNAKSTGKDESIGNIYHAR